VLGLRADSAVVVVSSCLVLVNGMCPGIGKDHSGERLGLGPNSAGSEAELVSEQAVWSDRHGTTIGSVTSTASE
jgi:hypothetical protein